MCLDKRKKTKPGLAPKWPKGTKGGEGKPSKSEVCVKLYLSRDRLKVMCNVMNDRGMSDVIVKPSVFSE